MKKTNWNDNWLFWNSKDSFALVWDIPEIARKVDLPHDAMIEGKAHAESLNGGNTGFFDGGSYTYVKMFESKAGDRKRNIVLRFDGVYMNTFVYVNGQLAANRPYGYSQFYVPISHLLKEEGQNEIRVQVRNAAMANSRWYSGSGIYRDVFMLTSGPVYIKEEGLKVRTENCNSEEATLSLTADICNKEFEAKELDVLFEVFDEKNNKVACEKVFCFVTGNETGHASARLHIDSPSLWSEDTPVLYTVKATLLQNDNRIDEEETSFGIRTLLLDSSYGLRVNGKSVKLRGACIHHDSGILGAKTYYEVEYRRVKLLKEAGFNAIRMSHHPAAPALLRACDELGMYVMDEGFDMWTRAKSDYDYNLFFTDWWKKDVEAMVMKDYNHPSVIMYSIGNEIPEIGTDQGAHLAAKISGLCHELDSSRYTLASINGVFAAGDSVPQITADVAGEVKETDDSVNVNDFMTIMDKYMDRIVVHPAITSVLKKACAATDIAGYNYMTARYSLDAKNEPNRVMVGSETYPPEIAVNWREVKKYPQVIGDFTWTGWDYLGEAGVGIPAYKWGEGGFGAQFPARLAYCGDIDITGFRRPLSYYREIVFGLRKAPYIAVQDPAHYGENLIKTPWVMSDATSSWNFSGSENKPVIVEVYSAGDEVELFCNDVSLGKKAVEEADNFRTLFETTYQPGTLRAVSYKEGKALGEYKLVTAAGEKELKVQTEYVAEKMTDYAFVNISIQDKEGNVFTDCDETVSVTVDGEAELLGTGSGNPKSMSAYTENSTDTWNGRAFAIIRKGAGSITISAGTQSGLQAELTI
jgi:beta-galactosidase